MSTVTLALEIEESKPRRRSALASFELPPPQPATAAPRAASATRRTGRSFLTERGGSCRGLRGRRGYRLRVAADAGYDGLAWRRGPSSTRARAAWARPAWPPQRRAAA